ncbi:MAG: hypothetical protein L3J19_09455 [Sulfurimonas sp.]|nr:hypothetical protein [Sulfurimonas sp.]
MKFLTLIFILGATLFATQANVNFYNASKKNQLLCKFTATSYKEINQTNSSVKKVNQTIFFKIKDENLYINSNSCHPIKKDATPIIF